LLIAIVYTIRNKYTTRKNYKHQQSNGNTNTKCIKYGQPARVMLLHHDYGQRSRGRVSLLRQSDDVDSRCLSPHLGCRWLAAVLFFVNKLNRVKFITKICIAPTALRYITVYSVFTAAVQLPHTYDSFGDLNRIQPQYHTPPWKVSLLQKANALFVHLTKRQHTL